MNEILGEVLELLENGREFALVKLGAESGSTPRAEGAEMLVRADGSIAGTIGGGLLELTMMKAATEAIAAKRSRMSSLSLAGKDLTSAEKMVCGGTADVLVTYVPPGDPALLEACAAIRAALASRRRAWLFTIVAADAGADADAAVEHCVLDEDGRVAGRSCEPAALRAAIGPSGSHGSSVLPDGRQLFVEPFAAAPLAVICGAGHVGRALAPVAAGVGFDVVVIDDREEFATPERFPGSRVLFTPFEGSLGQAGVGEDTYVVIVTKGHVHDMSVLEQALRSPARYIGLMASRGKRERIYAALREAGVTEDDLQRVHSPIGLDIGAETPAELAISIVAEMVKVRAGKR